MTRYQLPRDRAFAFLARASSTSNIELRDVAAEIVAELDNTATDDGQHRTSSPGRRLGR